jgi:hypothetical protein
MLARQIYLQGWIKINSEKTPKQRLESTLPSKKSSINSRNTRFKSGTLLVRNDTEILLEVIYLNLEPF